MRVIRVDLNHLKHSRIPMCACIGYFDGLHRGHQKLIEKTCELGRKYNCETALITFDPDPWVVIKGMSNVKHLSTMAQRMNRAVSYGIDNIVLLNFTRDMSELSPQDFVDKILGSLNLKALVCGFDFSFADHGKGNAAFLQEHAPFEVAVIARVEDEKGKISSTRISECVGLNIHDVDFKNMCIKVTRKGGKEALVYFSDEAAEPLSIYIDERKKIDAASGHENALFLSSQRKRISVRTVENMVKKYARSSVPLKHITPHKLRSTFGTNLYRETDDIYLVADVLGHSDVNTTRKHYADMDDYRKRRARNTVQLREHPSNPAKNK